MYNMPFGRTIGLTKRTADAVGDLLPGKDGLTVIAGFGVLTGLASAAGATGALVLTEKANKKKAGVEKTLLYAAALGSGVLALESAVQAYDLITPRLGCTDCDECNSICGGCCGN
jgi:hypothetical protein